MTGFIITGHGSFASGLYSSCKMLIGEFENIEVVDFIENTDLEVLEKQYEEAISKLQCCGHILICCDLFGGTPFNQIMMKIAENTDKFTVLAGINLPSLLEAILKASQGETDRKNYIAQLKEIFSKSLIDGIEMLSNLKEY